MPDDQNTCQYENLTPASQPISKLVVVKDRIQWHLQRDGTLNTMRLLLQWFSRQAIRLCSMERLTEDGHQFTAAKTRDDISQNLRSGDIVEVLSESEIRRTLDSAGRHRGLFFMPDMTRYCGRQMRVFKPVRTIILESTGESRKIKNTVLLEGSICNGVGMKCDRACFHLWREAWLKRVEGLGE